MFIKKEMQLNGIKNVRVKLLPELEVAIWCRSVFNIQKQLQQYLWQTQVTNCMRYRFLYCVVDWFNTISGTATTKLFPGININGCFYMNVWTLM